MNEKTRYGSRITACEAIDSLILEVKAEVLYPKQMQ